jgi:ATP-binding cassette subfamily B multidrug efflux pump
MIKKLAASIREYKKASVLTPIFIVLELIIDVFIPYLMSKLIDNGINKNDMNYILKFGFLLVLLALLSLVFGILAGKYSAEASSGFAKNLRKDMYYSIQNYSFSNIDKFSTSSIITRLTTDVTNIQNAFMMIIRVAVRSPGMLIFALVMSFTIDAKLALIFLAVIPVLGYGLYTIIMHAHPLFERVFKTYDKLNGVVQENLHGIRVVKTFTREEHEIQKFNTISNDIYKDFSSAEKIVALNSPLMQFCMYTCTLLISWLGAKAIVASGNDSFAGLSTGELTSLFSYTSQILISLMMLSMVFVTIIISRASAERIIEVLDEKSDITNNAQPVFEVKDGSISFKNVNFAYSRSADKLCLNNINIDILSGETVGIIGGTGSSKSTFVSLIPRLYDVKEGSVSVGGVDVRNYDLEVLRSNVAMVLQKNVLFSGTIKENLRWGKEDATDEEIIHACKLAQADEFINRFPDKYETYIEQGGTNVSGGQKQRLCIARALLKNPKILILDDSTSAVDTATDAQIRKAFKETLPDVTKIIIAQRVSSIKDADKIIVLDDGKIAACGTHDELLESSEIYKEVFESQTRAGVVNE